MSQTWTKVPTGGNVTPTDLVGSSGSSGQVLTTNGSSSLSWSTASGGGDTAEFCISMRGKAFFRTASNTVTMLGGGGSTMPFSWSPFLVNPSLEAEDCAMAFYIHPPSMGNYELTDAHLAYGTYQSTTTCSMTWYLIKSEGISDEQTVNESGSVIEQHTESMNTSDDYKYHKKTWSSIGETFSNGDHMWLAGRYTEGTSGSQYWLYNLTCRFVKV